MVTCRSNSLSELAGTAPWRPPRLPDATKVAGIMIGQINGVVFSFLVRIVDPLERSPDRVAFPWNDVLSRQGAGQTGRLSAA